MTATLRIACAGAGGIAARHLETLTALPGVEAAGIWSRTHQRAAQLAAAHGTVAVHSLDELLDGCRPDALLVCVTPGGHGELERAAIERGLPMLIEKPLATTWETAADIAAALERRPVIPSVAYQMRYQGVVERARRLIDGREVAMVHGQWLDESPPPAWWQRQEESGGQMVEQATHVVDLARLLAGEAVEVHAMSHRLASRTSSERTVDDVSSALVRYRSGAVGTFTASSVLPRFQYRVALEIVLDDAVLQLTPRSLRLEDRSGTQEWTEEGDARLAQDTAFVEAVRTGDPSPIRSSYADALLTHALTTGIATSAAEHRPIQLAEPATA
jgi:myo-inositol 2-dehydrogenase/D-chiro-inositol 1-dehydrogenase